jgi:hypothetical protein
MNALPYLASVALRQARTTRPRVRPVLEEDDLPVRRTPPLHCRVAAAHGRI